MASIVSIGRRVRKPGESVNVLYVSHSGKFGGAQNSLKVLLAHLDRSIYSPFVVCGSDGDFYDHLLASGIETRIIPMMRLSYSRFRLKTIVLYLYGFIRFMLCLWRRKIHIIHTNTLFSFYGSLVSRLFNIPHIWHLRESIYDPEYRFMVSRSRVAALVRSGATRVVCNSEFVKRSSRLEDAVVVPNAVEAVPAFKRRVVRPPFIIGNVGMLSKKKNQALLIRAAVRIIRSRSDVVIRLYGSYEGSASAYYELLRKVAGDLEVEKIIEFHGFTPQEMIYNEIDLLVHTGLHEAFGRVLIEGMSHGIPVVAVESGGIPEVVSEESGLIARPEASDLASKILHLLEDRPLYHRLSKGGHDRVKSHYTPESYTARIQDIYSCIT